MTVWERFLKKGVFSQILNFSVEKVHIWICSFWNAFQRPANEILGAYLDLTKQWNLPKLPASIWSVMIFIWRLKHVFKAILIAYALHKCICKMPGFKKDLKFFEKPGLEAFQNPKQTCLTNFENGDVVLKQKNFWKAIFIKICFASILKSLWQNL